MENGKTDELNLQDDLPEKSLLDTGKDDARSSDSNDAVLKNSKYCMFICMISVSSVMMSTGIAVGAMTPSIAILSEFYNETYQDRYQVPIDDETIIVLVSLSVSGLLAGGIIGALSIGVILTHMSRKQSMIIMNITNVIAVLVLCLGGRLIPSYECIIIGRFIMGLFSGFGMNLIPIVVAETSNSTRKDFYLSLIGVNLSFGCLFGLLLGFEQVLGTEDLWPILLSISVFPSLAYILFSHWLPESPSYLLRIGKRTEALRLLRRLREDSKEEDLNREISQIEREQRLCGEIKQVDLSTMLSRSDYRRQLFAVVMIFMQSQLCGVNGVGMYTNYIFTNEVKFTPDQATVASTVVYSVQFVIAVIGSGAVDRFDPKWINVISGSVMTLMIVLLTIALGTVDPEIDEMIPAMRYVCVAAVTIFALSWSCGINLTLFPLLAALTTEPTRETAFKFGGGIFWILSWFVSFIPPYLMNWIKSYAFLPWAFFNASFAIYVALCIPKTKGKSPEQIQARVQGRHRAANGQNKVALTSV